MILADLGVWHNLTWATPCIIWRGQCDTLSANSHTVERDKKVDVNNADRKPTIPCFYLTPEQDDFNRELQICITEALYDVDSIVADPEAYTKEELATLHSQIVSNLEQAWEIPKIS